MPDPLVSTGRGGAGNIGRDDTVYTDGGIVREGFVGESDHAEYSSGRGGAGNIVDSPRVRPSIVGGSAASEDVIPEPAMHNPHAQENFHTGRGGGGNVHKDKYGGHSHSQEKKADKESLGDKVKHLFGKDK
ncbi:hypothetical protein MBLNU459_g4668t1 [Dothideomycetes sp. NU459]